jgi:hypothetical protein
MATDAPITTRGELITNEDTRLAAVRSLAKLMDTAITLPGTNIKIGLDSLIGLIPGVGDLIGSAIGGYIVLVASQMGVSRVVIARMLLNLGIDAAVGVVPVVGDVLDVAWKANVKNVQLLEKSLADPRAAKRGSLWLILGIVAAVVLLSAGATALTWYLLSHISWK